MPASVTPSVFRHPPGLPVPPGAQIFCDPEILRSTPTVGEVRPRLQASSLPSSKQGNKPGSLFRAQKAERFRLLVRVLDETSQSLSAAHKLLEAFRVRELAQTVLINRLHSEMTKLNDRSAYFMSVNVASFARVAEVEERLSGLTALVKANDSLKSNYAMLEQAFRQLNQLVTTRDLEAALLRGKLAELEAQLVAVGALTPAAALVDLPRHPILPVFVALEAATRELIPNAAVAVPLPPENVAVPPLQQQTVKPQPVFDTPALAGSTRSSPRVSTHATQAASSCAMAAIRSLTSPDTKSHTTPSAGCSVPKSPAKRRTQQATVASADSAAARPTQQHPRPPS